MHWSLSHRADPRARVIADRHYNRQKIGAKQFVPPGRCLVLVIPDCAFWVTSWPFAQYVNHAWAGAWVCSAFRNERPDLYRSSDLIVEALMATRHEWPNIPALGMITFVDRDKTRPKRDPGRCYRKAGFHLPTRCARVWHDEDEIYNPVETAAGLVALQLLPDEMPLPCPPLPDNFYEVVRAEK